MGLWASTATLLIAMLAWAGCGSDGGSADAGGAIPAARDAASDAAPDAARDAAPDAVPDAARDAASDAVPDAVPDAAPDAVPDAVPDAAPDAAPDAVPDAAPDAAPDAMSDVDVASPWPKGEYISVDEVYARLQARDPDMLLVNVVDVQFYDLGFLPGSLKIPWDTLAGRLGELDPVRHVVLYCRKGVRSESAYTTLVDAAFPFVWVMEGGIERWTAAGYATVAE